MNHSTHSTFRQGARKSLSKRSGKGSSGAVILLLLMASVMGLLWYLGQKKEEPKPVEQEVVVEKKEEPKPKVDIPAPKKEEPKEVIVPEPKKEVEKKPEIVVEEKPKVKTEVDLYLEEKFPMPEIPSLEKIVKGWTSAPKKAFPESVTVTQAVEYKNEETEETRKEAAGHQTKPMKFKNRMVLLALPEASDFVATVAMEQTDFQAQVTQRYEVGVKKKIAQVEAQRAAYYDQAVEELAKLKALELERQNQPKYFNPKRYGSKYRRDYWPSTANNKNNKTEHEIPLGPLCGAGAVLFGEREIRVVSLWKKGPAARAGLEQGDVITRVNGKRLKEYSSSTGNGHTGGPEDLGLAILEAQANNTPLELTVKRGQSRQDIKVELPALPDFMKNFPENCPRSQALSDGAAAYLVEVQKDNGLWHSNDYSSAWCALALLSTGDKKHSREIKAAARHFAKKYDLGSSPSEDELLGNTDRGSASNWHVPMVGIFLAEYYLATGDRQVLKALDHCCHCIRARLESGSGRLGHSKNGLPYQGKGLVIVNTQAHVMWALADQIEALDKSLWDAWDLSYKSVEASISGGAVGYNFSARGGGQSTPRTGSMLTALAITKKNKKQARGMADWLEANPHQFLNVHAMTSIGPVFGFMGLKNVRSERPYRKAMDYYRWYFALVQPANYKHGSYYYGERGNSGGDEYCKKRLCGNFMNILVLNSHRNDTLWVYGNRKKKWYK